MAKLLKEVMFSTTSLLTLITSVLAHSGHNETQRNTGAMMGGRWMHTGADMMGYNMWGMGWFGLVFGIAFWILIILAIVYLVQKITENGGENE